MSWRDLLDWEENVFRGLVAFRRRFRTGPADAKAPPGAVTFEELQERLAVLAQLLTGEPVKLRAGPGVGGLRGAELLLPATVALATDADENRDVYRAQVVVLAGMRRLHRRRPPLQSRYEGALETLRLTRAAVDAMAAELPGFRELHDRVIGRVLAVRSAEAAPLEGREAALERARCSALAGGRPWDDPELRRLLVGPRRGRARSADVPVWSAWLESPGEATVGDLPGEARREPDDPTTEIEAPAVSGLRRVQLDSDPENPDPPPMPPFERAETLDAYRGGQRDLDGTDELEAHLDALREVDLGDLFRGNQTSSSLLKLDLDLGSDVADAGADDAGMRGIAYDEWDARSRSYRRGWCTVYPAEAPQGDAAWARAALETHRGLAHRLRAKLEVHRAGLRPATRQLDGEEIDLAAAIDDRAARRAGRGGDPRLYVRQMRRRRDFATLVLLDVSMSTDSWVDDRRILDVAREATLVLGEVSQELGDRLQVFAFASETRNRCLVWKVFGEGESWAVGRRRLAGLEPRGYTRIGPALRHATAVLAATPAEKRLLLLISDGKPTDYDRYEGRYGVADVRQALREARMREVHTHALAVDAVARDGLPVLFGRGGYHLLPTPDGLVEALTSVYGRLTAR